MAKIARIERVSATHRYGSFNAATANPHVLGQTVSLYILALRGGISLGAFSTRILANQLATTLDPTVPWTLVAAASLLSTAIALSATYLPRRTAKRSTIIAALRFD